MLLFTLLNIHWVATVSSDFHILAFYYLLNHGRSELTEYSMVAMLDDQQIAYFDSTLQGAVPRQWWMAYSFPREHWDAIAITVAGFHGIIKGNVEIVYRQHSDVTVFMGTFSFATACVGIGGDVEEKHLLIPQNTRLSNHQWLTIPDGYSLEFRRMRRELLKQNESMAPADFFVQGICGCELKNDNSTDGFIRLGYNGKDACVFDKETMSWIILNSEFQVLADRWNINLIMNKYFKALLEKDCVKWLLVYLECGQEALQQRGFYPQAIEVSWLKDGEWVPEIESSDVLPNHDGTYQVMKMITLNEDEEGIYSCYIEHATLLQGLNIPQGRAPKKDKKTMIVAGVAIVPFILLGIIIGIGFWRKKNYSKPLSKQQGLAEISQDQQSTVVTRRDLKNFLLRCQVQ